LALDRVECQPSTVTAVRPKERLVPTYQYSCTECGHFFEAVQSFSDDSLTVCPECNGRLRKVFNAVGVVFKGSGFYRTDSRGAPAGATAAGDSGATKTETKSGTKSEGTSTAKSDSKPAATAATSAD
jgi:putative FmdB family regulatory protein